MEKFNYKYDDLFNPILKALHELGGSGTNSEIEEVIIQILRLTDEEIDDIHRGNTTKLSYRSAWARNYLKKFGLLENSARGVWALTSQGKDTSTVDKEKVKKSVKAKGLSTENNENEIVENEEIENINWEEELIEILKGIEPSAFERLSQRLLRELGFTNVEVTGKSGDGGIDGIGVIKVGGILSFQVVFQCKRYKGTVSSSAIRDFRGAMIGRADKGLFITTGVFSRDAKNEAKRDGAPPIDLIDGNEFANKLKELRLGVKIELIEDVEIDRNWFSNL